MSSNLSDLVKSYVSPELISEVSTFLGEDVSGVSKAVDASIPTLLSSMASTSLNDQSSIYSHAKQAAQQNVLENLPGLFAGSPNLLSIGSGLISDLLGTNTGVISSLISSYAGIKPSSATALLSAVATLASGVVGKQSTSNGLDAAGVASLLSSQKDVLIDSIPAELHMAGLIGTTIEKSEVYSNEVAPSRIPVWVLPLLLLVSGGLLVWYFIGESKLVAPEVSSATRAVQDVTAAKQILKVELPDGVILDAYRGGIEDQLVNFLKDPSSVAGKDVWFDFDNLNFATGTADINPESQAQINNIAAILKAFPNARIKIGGYTDKTGDESANLILSKNRAEAVKSALEAAGVGAQVTAAEGYGSQYAKIPAEAPETSRAVDRRVSVSVREK